MFTGIVAAQGRITHVIARGGNLRLTIEAGALGLADTAIGDSIAVNGVCLTVVSKAHDHFEVDVSQETLNCTVGLDAPGAVNLEQALRAGDRLDGHLVSGHVDGVGEVTQFVQLGERGESWLLRLRAPAGLAKYVARKGSITVNGVSLTVNEVEGAEFSVNLIPHTLEVTTLKHLKAGSRVNLEVDMIARYVERLLSAKEA